MDKKTKHRILGILVVIGLVIILLPFLQTEKEFSQEATLVKAPPFPDQSVQVTSAVNSETHANSELATGPKIQTYSSDSPTDREQIPDDTINVVHPSMINNQIPEMGDATSETNANAKEVKIDDELNSPIVESEETKATEIPSMQNQDEESEIRMINKQQPIEEKKIQKALKVAKSNEPKPFVPKIKPYIPETLPQNSGTKNYLDKDGLAKLQEAAWVIQIGSFKNKANALRLVNQLRAKGYKAFIQQVSTTFGDSTRVFVGPETKHTAARAVANQLENDLNIHGVVISYKPLAL